MGCVTLELPVPPESGGEWQRPLDLRLSPTQPEKVGSLAGLKVRIDCGHWDSEKQSSYLAADDFCRSLRNTFTGYGATINPKEFDLNIRVLRGDHRSISCGLAGWLTYLTLGAYPCKTQQWSDGNIQFLNRSGAVIAHEPLKFRRVQYFGWVALFSIQDSNTLHEAFDEKLRQHTINRTYTLAVQKSWLKEPL